MTEDKSPIAEDNLLISRFKQGDESAFTELIQKYSRRIYQIAWAILQNREDAEEVTQDTFIRMHRALPSFRGDSQFTTWMHTIAANLAKNKYQWNKSRGTLSNVSINASQEDSEQTLDLPDEHPSPQQQVLWSERSQQLQQALAEMPDTYKQALLLHNVDGLQYDEIASILQCEIGTVKSRIARAREFLRTKLNPS